VTICEASDQLGGKASARKPEASSAFPLPVEHGPHFVAAWYRNTLSLMDRIGVRDMLVGYDGYDFLFPSVVSDRPGRSTHVLVAGHSPRASLKGYLANLRDGPAQWPLALQSALLMLDLLTMKGGSELDELSVAGLIHSRWYGDRRLSIESHLQILRAASVPAALASVQTMRRLVGLWLSYPRPFLSVLSTDLTTGLIDPLAQEVSRVAQIRLGAPVAGLIADEHEIGGLRLTDGAELRADITVAAAPVEVTSRWVDDAVHLLDGRLATLHRLRTAPMASFQMVFDRPLAGLPPGVVYLLDSSPIINLIDLAQVWRDLPPRYGAVLSIIVSDYDQIRGLSEERQIEIVLAELGRYLPDARSDALLGVAVRRNLDEPLFINTAGSWSNRPRPGEPYGAPQGAGRLHVVGDYTQTPVDLACMEGAVVSGLLAARAIARRYGRSPGLEILELGLPGARALAGYRLAKHALAPFVAAGLVASRRRAID
jgi:uncharacterized protein with NAD-binding domain and iron-sulfur cluster